jgi:tetratricopeptide (TPR) repeat protein
LAQFSVFRGGFGMESAEEVLDLSAWPDAPWALDVVGSLFDKSLLHSREVRGQPRFAMYVSIQEYAAEKLAQEALPQTGAAVRRAVMARHAKHYASISRDSVDGALYSVGGVERGWMIRVEYENLLAGVDAALSQGDLESAAFCGLGAAEKLEMTGPFRDGVELISRLLDADLPEALGGRLILQRGWLKHLGGRSSESREDIETAIRISRRVGDMGTEGIALGNLGNAHAQLVDMEAAEACYEEALAIHRAVGNRRSEGVVLGNLGLLYAESGRFEVAWGRYQEALEIHREVGNRRTEGHILGSVGSLCRRTGRYEQAEVRYEQALAVHREVGDRRFEGIVLGNLGSLLAERGVADRAREKYEAALAIHRAIGNRRFEAVVLGGLATLYHDSGELSLAREHYDLALAMHREIGNPRSECIALGNLGDLQLAEGDLAAAQASLEEAVLLGDATFPAGAAAFRASLGLIAALRGDFPHARAYCDNAALHLKDRYVLEHGKVLCKRARVEMMADESEAAQTALAEAEAIAKDIGAAPDSDLGQALAEARAALSA